MVLIAELNHHRHGSWGKMKSCYWNDVSFSYDGQTPCILLDARRAISPLRKESKSQPDRLSVREESESLRRRTLVPSTIHSSVFAGLFFRLMLSLLPRRLPSSHFHPHNNAHPYLNEEIST